MKIIDMKIIDKLKELVKLENESLNEQQKVINEWGKYIGEHGNDKNDYFEQKLKNIDGYGNTYYKEYYDIIHRFMTTKEIDKINFEIGYDFMSLKFIEKIKNKLKINIGDKFKGKINAAIIEVIGINTRDGLIRYKCENGKNFSMGLENFKRLQIKKI